MDQNVIPVLALCPILLFSGILPLQTAASYPDTVFYSYQEQIKNTAPALSGCSEHCGPGLLESQDVQQTGILSPDFFGNDYVTIMESEPNDSLDQANLLTDNLAGSSRYETAAAIARRLAAEVGPLTDAVIAVGTHFPDALSAASYAAILNQPILLVQTTVLPPSTEVVITELGIENVVVAGGIQAVIDDVMHQLPVAGTRTRIAASNRYTIAVALAKHFALDTVQSYMATGVDFPDAITGAVLAARNGSGILLVNGAGAAPPMAVQDFVVDQMIEDVFLFGGPDVISTALESWF